MNENSGETPNPLNPNPGMNSGVNPGPLDANPSEPVMPTAEPAGINPGQMAPNTEMVAASQPVAPTGKKKTGLIVGMLVALFLAVGCGVAAVLMNMNANSGDPVAMAVNKIMNGEAPNNVAAKGAIDIAINDDESPVTNLKIDLDSEIIMSSLINNSKATLTATFKDAGDVTVEIDEMRAADGDLYLKVEGLMDALENPKLLKTMFYGETEASDVVVDCTEEEGCVEDVVLEEEEEVVLDDSDATADDAVLSQYAAYLANSLEIVDGEWVKVSLEEINEMMNSSETNTNSCLVDLISDVNQNRNSFASIYSKNAFIGSATGEVSVVKKNDPIYRVAFDKENMLSFMSELDNSEIIKTFNECQVENDEDSISIVENQDSIIEALSKLPAIFVEVNKDYNITRLYSTLSSDEISITVDLGFSYPENVNVSEPNEYKNLTDVMQQLFTSVYED
ncbi:hypothetical protein IJJ05_02525 [Candidatus Saccharibacteria bacterium]|nr:hypothetical protein [Candidatus Saccharibacteria bacterium]